MSSSRQSLRVLMTADAVGGVWTYALELARALAPHGVHVDLAVMGPEPDAGQRREAGDVRNAALHVGAWRLEWMEDPWDDVARAGDWLLALARELSPDVVHLNGFSHGALPWTVPTVVVAHSDVCSWWRAVHRTDAPAEWDRYRAAVAAGLHAASLVVAPTFAMLRALAPHYGAPARAMIVHNGRELRGLQPQPKERLIVTVGRLWDEAKNVGALARAAASLPWPVLVAGDAAPPEHAHGAARPGRSTLRPLGMLPSHELAAWLQRACIFALPARYEPFGLAALEAALAGCALVLGDVESLREVWGDAATFVDPAAPDALAAALLALIDRPALLDERGRAAHDRARDFSPARMAAGYLTAYRRAASVTSRQQEPWTCAS